MKNVPLDAPPFEPLLETVVQACLAQIARYVCGSVGIMLLAICCCACAYFEYQSTKHSMQTSRYASSLYYEGVGLMRAGRYRDAEKKFKAVVSREEQSVGAWTHLAECTCRLEERRRSTRASNQNSDIGDAACEYTKLQDLGLNSSDSDQQAILHERHRLEDLHLVPHS